MKKVLFTVCMAVASMGAFAQTAPAPQQQEKPANPNAPKFEFLKTNKTDKTTTTHDFGTLKQGPVAEHKFKFKNVGKEPLIISAANASCGCTTPDYSKEPIKPGKTGDITVRYSTQGRPGAFTKTVFITSNAQLEAGKDRYEVYITGNVETEATPEPTVAPKQ